MYRLLRLIFLGTWELPKKCEHTYERILSHDVGNKNGHKIIYIYECSKCKNIKKFEVKY